MMESERADESPAGVPASSLPCFPPSPSALTAAAGVAAARQCHTAPTAAFQLSRQTREHTRAHKPTTPTFVHRSTDVRTSLPSLPRTRGAARLETTESTSGRSEPFRPVAGRACVFGLLGPAHGVAEPPPQPRADRAPS